MFLVALQDTFLKTSTAQASTLPVDEKTPIVRGTELPVKRFSKAPSGHLKIELVAELAGQTTWFAFGHHFEVHGSPPLTLSGTDSMSRVNSNALIQRATGHLGTKPLYWGRYFSGVDFSGAGEYMRAEESRILNRADIRVLPIGRFTTQVGLGIEEGKRDGQDQAGDLIASFGEDYLVSQGGEFYLFLDVEPSDPLSTAYYTGWSRAVEAISQRVKILPCVYLNRSDSTTSRALARAMDNGASCHGLWIANFTDNRFPRMTFDANHARTATPVDAPVLFWQYAGDIDQSIFDFNLSNPDADASGILSRLVLPPEG